MVVKLHHEWSETKKKLARMFICAFVISIVMPSSKAFKMNGNVSILKIMIMITLVIMIKIIIITRTISKLFRLCVKELVKVRLVNALLCLG